MQDKDKIKEENKGGIGKNFEKAWKKFKEEFLERNRIGMPQNPVWCWSEAEMATILRDYIFDEKIDGIDEFEVHLNLTKNMPIWYKKTETNSKEEIWVKWKELEEFWKNMPSDKFKGDIDFVVIKKLGYYDKPDKFLLAVELKMLHHQRMGVETLKKDLIKSIDTLKKMKEDKIVEEIAIAIVDWAYRSNKNNGPNSSVNRLIKWVNKPNNTKDCPLYFFNIFDVDKQAKIMSENNNEKRVENVPTDEFRGIKKKPKITQENYSS